MEQLARHYLDQWQSNRFQFLYHEDPANTERNYEELKKCCEALRTLNIKDVFSHKGGYFFRVLAKDERFIIAATDDKKVYTIIDTEYGVCGPSDRIFKFDLKSKQEIEDTLLALSKGEQYISYRHSTPIDTVLNIPQKNIVRALPGFAEGGVVSAASVIAMEYEKREKELAPGVYTKFVSPAMRLIIPSPEEITKIVIINFYEEYIHQKLVALKYCNHSKKKKRIENRLKLAQSSYRQWRGENVVSDSN